MGKWKDIDITLNRKNSGDINDYTNINAVEQSIKNILKTMQGSRRMLPSFALGVYNYLFEPIDETTAYEIGERILDAITDWDNRVIVEDILIKPNYDNNRYDVRITFKVRDLEEKREISTILNSF